MSNVKIPPTSSNFSSLIENLDDSSKWTTVQSDLYKPDRHAFIMDKFKEDFPNLAPQVLEFEKLSNLASRSKSLSDWLAGVNASYVLDVAPPLHLKNLIKPEQFISTSQNLSELSKLAAEKSRLETIAAKEYKQKLDDIQIKYMAKTRILRKDKYAFVLSLNSQDLPISLQIAIEAYNPAENTSAPNRRQYARELLIRYQQHLLQLVNEFDDIDIVEVVANNSVK